MRTSSTLSLLAFTTLLAFSSSAAANFHLIKITEVYAGSEQSPSSQFIELQMFTGGQTVATGHNVSVVDKNNVELARFTFTSDLANGADQDHMLVATDAAVAEFGLAADLRMTTASIVGSGGRVCVFDPPDTFSGFIDCVAWGDYAGSSTGTGTPAPVTLGDGLSLTRRINIDASDPNGLRLDGDFDGGPGGDDTDDSANDFRERVATPTNNARVNGAHVICGNGVTEAGETCDDDNILDLDGCSAACALEGAGEGEGEGAVGEGEGAEGEGAEGEGAEGEGAEGEGAEGEGAEGEGAEGEGAEGEGAEGEGAEGEGAGEGEGEGEGAGEGEGEGEGGGEACVAASGFNLQGTCTDGFVCVGLSGAGSAGTCQLKCGDASDVNGDGNFTFDEATDDPAITCGAATACIAQTKFPTLELTAVACLSPALSRDVVCEGLNDDDACNNGNTCVAASQDALRCKELCTSDTDCQNGETCAIAAIQDIDIEDDGAGAQLRCDDSLAACTAGDDAGCACDVAAGFECTFFNINQGGTGAFCNRPQRQCGVVIPAADEATLSGNVDPAKVCNVVDDSRYCDQSMFAGATAPPGTDICIGISQTTEDGICFALCRIPNLDADGNGAIDTAEQGADLGCGAGFKCTTTVGEALGVAKRPDTVKTCDSAACPVGSACDACGPGGDVQCLVASGEPRCEAPFGTCVVDDGSEGEGEGAAEGEGEGKPPEGCECGAGSTSTSTSPASAGVGVALVALLALRLRRRR